MTRGGPLDDVTVVEVANWVAAPSCGAMLADMGAEVVKVEPLGGDSMRGKLRQPVWPEGATPVDVPFHLDNRGKRSVAVDMGDERGAALVRELAAGADVFLTNLLPSRLARYGLGAEQLCDDNPGLVYAIVTGYGTSGTDADRMAFDLTAFFAGGGIMGVVGEPGEPPPAFRPGQGDHPTGLALLAGVLAALRVRDRTGRGQVVETALLRVGAWTIGCDVSVALVDGRQPNKRARQHAISPMNTRYRCADGVWVNLSTHDQSLWSRFCDALGVPEVAEDERFATPVDRFRNNEGVIALFDHLFASQPFTYWRDRLDRTGVVWARVAELPELVADPQARAAGTFATIDLPGGGSIETVAAPFSLGESTVAVRGPAPAVGEHTDVVLRRCGIEADRIESLGAAGVVGGPRDRDR